MVNDPDRDKVAKILHNGNVGSGELCDYDKCILEIGRFYDKIKNVDRLEAAKIDARKDSRYERREHAALGGWVGKVQRRGISQRHVPILP